MQRTLLGLVAVIAMGGGSVRAADAQRPIADTPDAPLACACVPAGTAIDLEIMDTLNSSRHKRGDRFALRVAEPLVADGTEIIPAGAAVAGEVVHAAAARGGGKPGELLIAARHVDAGGRTWPLRGLKLGVSGQDNAALALAVSFAAGPFAMFIRGREIEIPAGTRVHAKLASDLPLHSPDPIPDPTNKE